MDVPSTVESLLEVVSGKKLLVCDLDNTLMDETAWLFTGYDAVSKVAAPKNPTLAEEIGSFLRQRFLSQGRQQVFDAVKESFPESVGEMAEWLAALRCAVVPGGLTMAPWAVTLCRSVPGLALAILTNGHQAQQRHKFAQLQPAEVRDRFQLYCAANYAAKPDTAGLRAILHDFDCAPGDALFVGDTEVDRQCAEQAGVPFAWAPPLPL